MSTAHKWDRSGERCENCGDKDYMASGECHMPHRKVWSTPDGDCFPFKVSHVPIREGRFVPEAEYIEMAIALYRSKHANTASDEGNAQIQDTP